MTSEGHVSTVVTSLLIMFATWYRVNVQHDNYRVSRLISVRLLVGSEKRSRSPCSSATSLFSCHPRYAVFAAACHLQVVSYDIQVSPRTGADIPVSLLCAAGFCSRSLSATFRRCQQIHLHTLANAYIYPFCHDHSRPGTPFLPGSETLI